MRAEWRAEQEAATRDAAEDWSHRQTLSTGCAAHMHPGDEHRGHDRRSAFRRHGRRDRRRPARAAKLGRPRRRAPDVDDPVLLRGRDARAPRWPPRPEPRAVASGTRSIARERDASVTVGTAARTRRRRRGDRRRRRPRAAADAPMAASSSSPTSARARAISSGAPVSCSLTSHKRAAAASSVAVARAWQAGTWRSTGR